MTIEEQKQPEANETIKQASRPMLLTAMCLFAFILYGISALLFLSSMFFTGWISEMVRQYSPGQSSPASTVLTFVIAGFLLHAAAFFGLILTWRLRKAGFIIFGAATLLISAYELFQQHITPAPIAMNIALIILLGVFYKKYR